MLPCQVPRGRQCHEKQESGAKERSEEGNDHDCDCGGDDDAAMVKGKMEERKTGPAMQSPYAAFSLVHALGFKKAIMK